MPIFKTEQTHWKKIINSLFKTISEDNNNNNDNDNDDSEDNDNDDSKDNDNDDSEDNQTSNFVELKYLKN